MEVFSTVVVEISEALFALLPEIENSGYERQDEIHLDDTRAHGCPLEYFDRASTELTTNRRAKFLERKLKELNVSVVVTCENLSDVTSSLKLCGAWSEICTVRVWLMQFSQTAEHMQTVCSTEQLNSGIRFQAALTEHCTESASDGPRRSLRNHLKAKRDHNAKAVVSTFASSKQIKPKQLKRNKIQTKKGKVLLTDAAESKHGNCGQSEGMLESHANGHITKDVSDVNDIAPIMALSDEQFATENSIMENDMSSSIQTLPLVGSAEKCSELRQQLKGCVDNSESERQSALRELKCSSCDYVTIKQRNLLMHTARTHGDRSYICPTCSRAFAFAKDLNHHLKCHTEQYCCEHCGRTLKSKYAVALHVARIHKGLAPRPVKRYLCTLCGKMCRNKTDYNVHRNKEHTGVRPFHCDLCNASFFSRSNLRAHRQIHADTRTYECKQCGKAFKQRQGLRIHLAVHSVERRYKCDSCGKAFTQNSALVRHARTHTSVRPYACRLCPATFNDYSVLRRHMLGIHKLQDTAALRQSVQAACAEARLAEQSLAVKVERSHSDTTIVDSYIDSTMISDNNHTATSNAAVSVDVLTCIPAQPDGTPAGHLLAVGLLSSLSQDHTDPQASITDSLPHYFLIDASRSGESHQQKL